VFMGLLETKEVVVEGFFKKAPVIFLKNKQD
jgi:hypothetical protein